MPDIVFRADNVTMQFNYSDEYSTSPFSRNPFKPIPPLKDPLNYSLADLFEYYESDKGFKLRGDSSKAHGYCLFYEETFKPLKFKSIKLLELGISLNGGDNIASSFAWRDYFPNGLIIGLDFVDLRHMQEDRIKIEYGNQNDPAVLENLVTLYSPFDIIIDDASHRSDFQINSFKALFPFVKVGGWYVIEDLSKGTSDWHGHSNTPTYEFLQSQSLELSFFQNQHKNHEIVFIRKT